MSDRPETPLLDTVQYPADIRNLSREKLSQLADELRQETISAVSVTGGQLGAGQGSQRTQLLSVRSDGRMGGWVSE